MSSSDEPLAAVVSTEEENAGKGFGSSGPRRDAIRREAERVHETATYASETQFEYAKRWRRLDRWLATVSAGLAAAAGVGGLSNVLTARLAGLVAVTAAIVGAVAASINAAQTTETSARVANEYRALQQDIRIFLEVDLQGQSEGESRERLGSLIERSQQLNMEAEIPSNRAWRRAKKQIETGAQTYKADRDADNNRSI